MLNELVDIHPDTIETAKQLAVIALLCTNCLGVITTGVQALFLFMRSVNFPIDISDQYHLEEDK